MLAVAFLAIATTATALDSPGDLPPLGDAPKGVQCGGSDTQPIDSDQKPWVTNGVQPKVCHEDLPTAMEQAWFMATWAYGVIPQPDNRWKCDTSNCQEDQTCQAYYSVSITWTDMSITFDTDTGLWCAEAIPESYVSRTGSCSDCADNQDAGGGEPVF